MQVILKKDMAGLGRAGDMAEVTDAYARNMLIPQGLAELATPEARQKINAIRQKTSRAAAIKQQKMTMAKKATADQIIKITTRANAQGKLFAALKKPDFIQAWGHQIDWPDDDVSFVPVQIKTVGAHRLTINWPDGSQTGFQLLVSADGRA